MQHHSQPNLRWFVHIGNWTKFFAKLLFKSKTLCGIGRNFRFRFHKKRTASTVSASTSLMPMCQSSLQYDFCMPNHLVTRPVTKGRASPLWKNFLPPEKCLGHTVCITIVFVVTCYVTLCYILSM